MVRKRSNIRHTSGNGATVEECLKSAKIIKMKVGSSIKHAEQSQQAVFAARETKVEI